MLSQKVVVNASNEFVSKQYCSRIVSFSSCNAKSRRIAVKALWFKTLLLIRGLEVRIPSSFLASDSLDLCAHLQTRYDLLNDEENFVKKPTRVYHKVYKGVQSLLVSTIFLWYIFQFVCPMSV